MFPNGANAPLVTTVNCVATDAVANESTDSFDVTVISPVGYVNDYALLGIESLDIRPGAAVTAATSACTTRPPGFPAPDGLELRVALDGTLPTDGLVAGDTISLGARVVAGDVVYADALTADRPATFTPHGPCDPNAPASLTRCGYVPLWAELPAFLTGSPGSGSIKLGGRQQPARARQLRSRRAEGQRGGDADRR